MSNVPGRNEAGTVTTVADEMVRPGLAIISNVPRPDRVHVHERLADEIPEITVHSLFIRSGWQLDWNVKLPEKIHAVNFARGKEVDTKWRWWGRPWSDWLKSGPIIEYFRDNNIRAVILNGYSNLTAVRVLLWCNRNSVPILIRSDSNIRSERASSGVTAWLKKKLVKSASEKCSVLRPIRWSR